MPLTIYAEKFHHRYLTSAKYTSTTNMQHLGLPKDDIKILEFVVEIWFTVGSPCLWYDTVQFLPTFCVHETFSEGKDKSGVSSFRVKVWPIKKNNHSKG